MILILGGTKEGREIAAELISCGEKVKISVTTEYGASLLADLDAEVIVKNLQEEELRSILVSQKITKLIDATHPYAREITEMALSACDNTQTAYIRYERPLVNYPEEIDIIAADNYSQAAEAAADFDKIFLSTGSKNLKTFVRRVSSAKERLYARILPIVKSLQKAAAAGLGPENIVAMKGPFSSKLNRVILQEYDVDVLVSKASGRIGGLPAKLEAAKMLGLPVIIISRPDYEFPQVVSSLEELKKVL